MRLISRVRIAILIASALLGPFAHADSTRHVLFMDGPGTSGLLIQHREGRILFQLCDEVYGPTTLDRCRAYGPTGGIPNTELDALWKRLNRFASSKAAHHNLGVGVFATLASIAAIPVTFGASALIYGGVVAEAHRQGRAFERRGILADAVWQAIRAPGEDHQSFATDYSRDELRQLLESLFPDSCEERFFSR